MLQGLISSEELKAVLRRCFPWKNDEDLYALQSAAKKDNGDSESDIEHKNLFKEVCKRFNLCFFMGFDFEYIPSHHFSVMDASKKFIVMSVQHHFQLKYFRIVWFISSLIIKYSHRSDIVWHF